MSRRPRLAILASGTGTNAHALADAVDDGRIAADLAVVVADRPAAPVLATMRARGVPVLELDASRFSDKEHYELRLVAELDERGAHVIALAGYMRICGPTFLRAFGTRTFNIHPSFLPSFPGLDAIGQALEAGAAETGVTVHLIDDGIDTGPIIAQRRVGILHGDTRATLTARIQAAEHALYPAILAELIASSPPAAIAAPQVPARHDQALEPIT